MLEVVNTPHSLKGWEAIVVKDPKAKGLVLSDEYSEYLKASVITIDWNNEPPEIVMIDHEEMLELEDGFLLIRTAGRGLGFIPTPLIHKCSEVCTLHPGGRLSVE